jgi:hypothetical protein
VFCTRGSGWMGRPSRRTRSQSTLMIEDRVIASAIFIGGDSLSVAKIIVKVIDGEWEKVLHPFNTFSCVP